VPSIRVRFAPSPTGFLHVGGLRTALYNYLFARHNRGTFILRIEDTDRTRFVEGAVENLIATLRWSGLEYDEGPGKDGPAGPYIQSERLSLYREHAEGLVREGRAYYAFDTPEELDAMRRRQEERKEFPKYDRRALHLSSAEVERLLSSRVPRVIRMKIPESASVAVDDMVRGRVEFTSDQLDDQVLIKSDGYPTYHLANVVDDHTMGVTHIIRGEEWLPSTPKHVLLYRAFGWDTPAFAHLPLLLNTDRSKLSKRQGDVAVEEYRAKGYLPGALVNFVALLGWNPGDERELFSLDELVREFTLERVGKSGAIFDTEKLKWMNAQHLRMKPDDAVAGLVRPYLEQAGFPPVEDSYLCAVIGLMKERVETLPEYVTACPYFFRDPSEYDRPSAQKNWKPESPSHLREVSRALEGLDPFDATAIEGVVRSVASSHGVGAGRIIHALRLAVTGTGQGPGLFELMEVVGRTACVRRINLALTRLNV
jgi:glutamyl-tRNA synthetase